jgi:hypothetical protein
MLQMLACSDVCMYTHAVYMLCNSYATALQASGVYPATNSFGTSMQHHWPAQLARGKHPQHIHVQYCMFSTVCLVHTCTVQYCMSSVSFLAQVRHSRRISYLWELTHQYQSDGHPAQTSYRVGGHMDSHDLRSAFVVEVMSHLLPAFPAHRTTAYSYSWCCCAIYSCHIAVEL